MHKKEYDGMHACRCGTRCRVRQTLPGLYRHLLSHWPRQASWALHQLQAVVAGGGRRRSAWTVAPTRHPSAPVMKGEPPSPVFPGSLAMHGFRSRSLLRDPEPVRILWRSAPYPPPAWGPQTLYTCRVLRFDAHSKQLWSTAAPRPHASSGTCTGLSGAVQNVSTEGNPAPPGFPLSPTVK